MIVSSSDQETSPKSHLRGNLVWLIAVVLVAIFAIYAFGGFGTSSAPSSTVTTSTSYYISAASVVLAAAQQYPAGYNATSIGPLSLNRPGEQSASFALLSQSQSSANMTVIVFGSTNSSQSYYDSFTSGVRGLVGYTDISGALGGYEQYGSCYGYGEDVDGIAVANGVCTNGNVFLEVHLSSTESFAQIESDMSSLMGAIYQSVS
jgi:hypothetical protein